MKEPYFKGENLSERARKNLFILDAIRRRGPISKTDISGLIGLNVVTVSNYVDEFLRHKIVFEKEFDISNLYSRRKEKQYKKSAALLVRQ